MYTCKQFWLRWSGAVILSFLVSLVAGMVSGTTELTIPCIIYCILAALLLTPVYTKRLADAGMSALYWWIAAGVHVVWGISVYVTELMMADVEAYLGLARVMMGISGVGQLYCLWLTLVCGFKQSANNEGRA